MCADARGTLKGRNVIREQAGVVSASDAAPAALKPPVDACQPGAPRAAGRRVLAAHPRLRERQRGRVPRSQVAGEELDHQHRQAAGHAEGPGLGRVHRRRAARLRARADVGARVAVPAVADRLEQPRARSAAPAVHPARLAPAARSPAPGPRFAARARRHAGARADPPLRRQGAVPGARHLPGLLPLLHAQLRGRHRHGRGVEVPAQGERRALAADVRLHPLAARAGGHRHLGRRRVPAARPSRSRRSARRCCRSITSGGCATRPRGRR